MLRDSDGFSQKGLVSSHFFFRFLHVVQPVFDLAFACLDSVVGERGGCIRGLPRALRIRTGSVGEMGVSSFSCSSLTSDNCSSVSSTLGMTSLELVRVFARSSDCVSGVWKMFESKLGEVNGESLDDDMEGCGEELVLIRLFAPGGGWPKERDELIRLLSDMEPWWVSNMN